MIKSVEERLIELGGKVWDKKGRRIYISQIWSKMFDVQIEYYKTRRLKSFCMGGEKWSNNQASKFILVCSVAYYDCDAEKFVIPNTSYLPKSYQYYVETFLNKF